jgi:hypothetical protein
MSSLIERIRAARQTRVTVEGKTFIVRRPTDWEFAEMRKREVLQMDILERFVEGWEGVTELDLVPGGDASPVEFDKDLFAEWVADQDQYWTPITDAVVNEFIAHRKRLGETEKK